jgi:DegV family protein with EDD domain
LVYLAAKMQQTGADIDTVKYFVENNKLNLCHWFTVDDLFFLKRGGRVSAASAVVGSLLQIKPVLHVDNEGHLINVVKARGRRGAIETMLQKMKETVYLDRCKTVFISHGDCIEDAKYLADRIKAELGTSDIHINFIGPVIGSHSGPGTLALFFLGKER